MPQPNSMQKQKDLPVLDLVSDHDFAEIVENRQNGYRSLVSKRSFKPGELISSFSGGKIHEKPNYLTVQLDDSKHISLEPEFLQYINHSCDPNVFFDTSLMELRAIKFIGSGEHFSFFYPSTEWNMDSPFTCHCHSAQCIGIISGAKDIEKSILFDYHINHFIRNKKEQGK